MRSAGRPPSKRRFIARAAWSLVRFGRRTALHGTMGTTVLALACNRRGLNAGSALGERESREALGRRRGLAARGAHGRPAGVRAHATRAREILVSLAGAHRRAVRHLLGRQLQCTPAHAQGRVHPQVLELPYNTREEDLRGLPEQPLSRSAKKLRLRKKQGQKRKFSAS